MKIAVYIYMVVAFIAVSCNHTSDNGGKIDNKQLVSVVHSLLDSGEECFDSHDYLNGVALYADAYTLSKRSSDTALVQHCANKYIWASYRTGDLAQAGSLLVSHKATDYASKAVEVYLELKKGTISDSQDYFKNIWPLTRSLKDTLNLLFIEAQAYSAINNFKKATESYKEYASKLAQQNGYELTYVANKAKEKYKYITFVVLLITVSIIIVLIYRHKKVRRELETMLALAKELDSSKRKNDFIVEEKQRLITELFKNQFRYINELANNYYSYSSSPSASIIMYNHVKKTLEKIATENTSTKHLEKIINTYHNDVIAKIRVQVPSISEEHIRLYCYYCSGFSPQMISLLTNDGIDNVYKKKSRLKSKLSNSDAMDKEFFVSLIFPNQ